MQIKKKVTLIIEVLIFGILILSGVNASVEYTSTTDTICNNGVCTKTLYSGVRNIYEDNQWKRVEEARSLKDKGFNVVVLEDDKNYPVEVVDFNYTSIQVRLNPKGIKIFNNNIPVRIWKNNDTKASEFQKDVLKGEKISKGLKDYKEERDKIKEEFISFNLLNQEETKTYDFPYGSILEFGMNSTTIQIYNNLTNAGDTYANLDNLHEEDANTNYGSTTTIKLGGLFITQGGADERHRGYFWFNISEIPTDSSINYAELIMFKSYVNQESYVNISKVNYTYSLSQNETTLTWNNQICGTSITSWNSNCSDLGVRVMVNYTQPENYSYQFNVNKSISDSISNNEYFVLFALDNLLDTTTNINMKSREHADIEYRPYLNITYTEAETDTTIPNVTIITPLEQFYTTTSIIFNISVMDNDIDTCKYSLGDQEDKILMTQSGEYWINTNSTMTQGSHNATFYCNDTSNNINDSESVFFIIDSLSPSVTSLTETPPNSSIEQEGQSYEFNATVTEETGISTVLLEFNGVNYTATNLAGDLYNVTLTGLSDGTYNYKWFANDTLGNINNSETGSYTILQAEETPEETESTSDLQPLCDYVFGGYKEFYSKIGVIFSIVFIAVILSVISLLFLAINGLEGISLSGFNINLNILIPLIFGVLIIGIIFITSILSLSLMCGLG